MDNRPSKVRQKIDRDYIKDTLVRQKIDRDYIIDTLVRQKIDTVINYVENTCSMSLKRRWTNSQVRQK